MGKKDQPKLSKKERKKLEAKALKRAEKKLAAKAAEHREAHKKGQKKAKVKGAEHPTESAASASGAVEESSKRHPHLQHLDRVAELVAITNDDTIKKSARKAAEAELAMLRAEGEAINASKKPTAEMTVEEQDAEMKARIEARRAERGDDAPGSPARLRAMQTEVAERTGAPTPNDADARKAAAASITLGDVTPEATAAIAAEGGQDDQMQSDAVRDEELERMVTKAIRNDQTLITHAEEKASLAMAEKAGLEPVSTDGDNPVENFAFAKPSEAPGLKPEIPLTADNKQYLILREDGTEGRYTRATTYIDGLENTKALEAWKLRTLLEGIAVDNERTLADRDAANTMMGAVAQAIHIRDVALAKLAKADRKGKLEPGERGPAEEKINRAFKAATDEIAEDALELGGAHVKANKGTDLHKLTEVCDLEGIEAVRALAEAEEITPADLADIEAYHDAVTRAGLKIIAVEQVVVDDVRGVAGTTDRIVLAPGKLLGRTRAAKVIADVKTGNMEYAIGKTAMQITVYATSKAYTPGEVGRTDLGVLKPNAAKHPGKAPLKKDRPLKRDGVEAMEAYEARVAKYESDLATYMSKRGVGLLIHLPAGQARCTIHLVDLNLGAQGLKIIEQVRAWRNDGKRAIDLKANILQATAEE